MLVGTKEKNSIDSKLPIPMHKDSSVLSPI